MNSLFDLLIIANMEDNSYVASFRNAAVDVFVSEDDKVVITIDDPVRFGLKLS